MENLYREKILKDEIDEEIQKEQKEYGFDGKITFNDNKRRLQSAYRAGVGAKCRFNFAGLQTAVNAGKVGWKQSANNNYQSSN